MARNTDELEECVAQSNRSWGRKVVRELLTIELSTHSCCISLPVFRRDYVSAFMMHEYESQEREVVNFIVLMWPPLGE